MSKNCSIMVIRADEPSQILRLEIDEKLNGLFAKLLQLLCQTWWKTKLEFHWTEVISLMKTNFCPLSISFCQMK